MERLSFKNFFSSFYILDHQKKSLDDQDRTIALIASIALGLFTFGVVHFSCWIAEKCITQANKNDTNVSSTNKVAQNSLKQEVAPTTTAPPPSKVIQKSDLVLSQAEGIDEGVITQILEKINEDQFKEGAKKATVLIHRPLGRLQPDVLERDRSAIKDQDVILVFAIQNNTKLEPAFIDSPEHIKWKNQYKSIYTAHFFFKKFNGIIKH